MSHYYNNYENNHNRYSLLRQIIRKYRKLILFLLALGILLIIFVGIILFYLVSNILFPAAVSIANNPDNVNNIITTVSNIESNWFTNWISQIKNISPQQLLSLILQFN